MRIKTCPLVDNNTKMDIEDLAVIVICAVILSLVVVGFAAAYNMEKRACRASAELMGFDWQYNGKTGCAFEVEPDVWVQSKYYRWNDE